MAEGDVYGLGLVEAHESAAAELARLRGVLQRFPAPRKGSTLHLEALEGECFAHSFTVGAASRLTIKTKVTPPKVLFVWTVYFSSPRRLLRLHLSSKRGHKNDQVWTKIRAKSRKLLKKVQ